MGWKLAGKIIDQYDDPEIQDNLVAIKTAGISMAQPADFLPDSFYAVCLHGKNGKIHQKFPVGEPELLKTSAAYYVKNRENLPREIRQAAAYYIKEALAHYGLPKVAAVDEDAPSSGVSRYIYPEKIEIRQTGISKEAAFRQLTDKFHSEYALLPPVQRVKAAAIMMKIGEEIGEDVPGFLSEYIPRVEVGTFFKQALKERQRILNLERKQDAVTELQTLFKEAHNSQEAIQLLSAFDREHGLDDYSKFMDPYRAAYGGSSLTTPKTATHFGDMTGEGSVEHKLQRRYKLDSLITNMRSRLQEIYDGQTVDRITANPEAYYEEAGANEKRLLDQLMDEAVEGVDRNKPVYFDQKHDRMSVNAQ